MKQKRESRSEALRAVFELTKESKDSSHLSRVESDFGFGCSNFRMILECRQCADSLVSEFSCFLRSLRNRLNENLAQSDSPSGALVAWRLDRLDPLR